MICKVPGCDNGSLQGSFTGDVCTPCAKFAEGVPKGTRYTPSVLKFLKENTQTVLQWSKRGVQL